MASSKNTIPFTFTFIFWGIPYPVVHNYYIACTRSVGKTKAKKYKFVHGVIVSKVKYVLPPRFERKLRRKWCFIFFVYNTIFLSLLYLWNTDFKKPFTKNVGYADRYVLLRPRSFSFNKYSILCCFCILAPSSSHHAVLPAMYQLGGEGGGVGGEGCLYFSRLLEC